jgi:anti-anti-sigma regulatory factor
MPIGHAPTLPSWRRHRSPSGGGTENDLVSPGVIVAIVNAGGTIDGDSVATFEHEVGRTLEAGASRLLVDLSRADDITTAGMNTLLAARQRLIARGGRIAVVLSPRLRRRFQTLDLHRRFLLADNRLQAVRQLGLGDTAPPRTHAPRPHAHAA